MKEPATYPGSVWNGLSDNPARSSLNDDIPPDTRDWDRIVSEVIATQTQLTAVAVGASDLLEAVTDSGNGAMTWAGTWNNSATYHVGSVVYARDGLYYVALRDTNNDQPESSASDWRVISPPSAFLPSANTATGDPHDFYVLANSSGNTWYGLTAAMESAMSDNTDMDNRFEYYPVDPLLGSVAKGTPVRVYRSDGALATGSDDSGNLTANTAAKTSAYNGWMLTVVESPTGNRTNPVSVVDTPNTTVVCTVPNTGNTTWNAIVASWNGIQANIVADLVTGNYVAGVTSTGNSTILMGVDGDDIEQRITTINITANAKEATVFGLFFIAGSPGEDSVIQTGGTMTFNAAETVNTFNNATLASGNLLVPGETYYAVTPLLEPAQPAVGYCSPIGTVISPTEFRLRLGLPILITPLGE
jgi:hypothetical protein